MLLRLAAAAGLGYDAFIHLRLAGGYDAVGTTLTQGELFRVETAAAVVTGLAVLFSDRRVVWAAAGLVGLAGVAAVLLYRYVNLPAVGPIPQMYEPIWYPDKAYSAVAEVVVVMAWLIQEGLRRQPQAAPDAPAVS